MIDSYSVDGRLRSLMIRTLEYGADTPAIYAEARRIARDEANRLSVFSKAHWHYRRLAWGYRK